MSQRRIRRSRFDDFTAERKDARMPDGPIPILQKYFYEIAQGNTPGQLAALMKLVSISQVMFGSDYPFRPGLEAVEGLVDYRFSAADQRAIESGNASRLLPHEKAAEYLLIVAATETNTDDDFAALERALKEVL